MKRFVWYIFREPWPCYWQHNTGDTCPVVGVFGYTYLFSHRAYDIVVERA